MAAEHDGTEQTNREALVEAVVTRVMEKVDERLRRHEFTRNSGGPSLEDSGTSRDHPARSGNQHLPLSSHTIQAGPAMVLRALHRFAAATE